MPLSRTKRSTYREAKPLPLSLLDHCTTDIEEGLLSQGFSLLSNALTSGIGSSVAAQVPPTQHLAFAATLSVHPKLTTRTTSVDKHTAADDALRYLRQLHSLVGPRNAGLDRAFSFTNEDFSSRSKRAKTRISDITNVDEDASRIRSTYADQSSLCSNADDFWSIVGWAFNCSVAHPHRWDRWKLFLDFILDVIEDDLEDRFPQAQEAYRSGGATSVKAHLKDSLFAQYLLSIGEGRNNKRRLMRAVFANGTRQSLAEFAEIWKHETKLPKQEEDGRLKKRRKLDLDNGEFGDYFDDSDEESSIGPTPRSRSVASLRSAQRSAAESEVVDDSDDDESGARTPNRSSLAPGLETYGGIDAIKVRQRILALLTHYCAMNPDDFLDDEDLFDLYTEFIRPLPLPVFQQFVLPMKPYLGPNSQVSLNQMILRPLLTATAPRYDENALTQDDFVKHYALHPANSTSAVDNARVGLLLENLLRLLWLSGGLRPTEQLRATVQQGIHARKEKVAFDGRKKVGVRAKAEEEALAVLDCSGDRMLMVIDMVV